MRLRQALSNPALTPEQMGEIAARRRAEEQEQEEQRRRLGLSAAEPSSKDTAAQLLFQPGALTPTLCALSRVLLDGKPCCSSREPLHVSEYAEFMCSAGCVVHFHPICARGYTRLCESQGDKLKFAQGMRCLTDIACPSACPTGKGVSYLRCGDVREKHFLDKDWKDRRKAEQVAAAKARKEHREREKQKQMQRNAQKKAEAQAEGDREAAVAAAGPAVVAPPAVTAAASPNALAPEPGSGADKPLSVKEKELLAELRDPKKAAEIMALPREERRKAITSLLPKEQAPAVRFEDQERLVQRDKPVLVIQPKPTPEEPEAEVAAQRRAPPKEKAEGATTLTHQMCVPSRPSLCVVAPSLTQHARLPPPSPLQQHCVRVIRRDGRREQPVGGGGGRLQQPSVGRRGAAGRGRPVPRPARRVTCAGDPTQGGQGCGGNGASSSASGRRRQSQGEWRTRVTARRRRERRQGEWGASLTAQGRCEGKGGTTTGGCGAPNQHQG